MATLKAIRKRISSTKNTEKLTKAMKMISAVKLRKAQKRALDSRVYNSEITRIFAELIKRNEDIKHPFLNGRTQKTSSIDLVIITSDKGLCGAFNENLLKKAIQFIGEKQKEGLSVKCYVSGKKGHSFLKRHNIEVYDFDNLNFLINNYLYRETDEVILAFNRFKGVGNIEIAFKKLLPVETVQFQYCVDYIYEPERDQVLDWCIKQLVESNFNQSFFESMASEQAARMIAMEKATKNAGDLIIRLTTQYNRARQSAITKELIDIVGTAEALK